jgi:effector-binding domain-containing protein
MSCVSNRLRFFLLFGLVVMTVAPLAAQVTAKNVPEGYILYRENVGPYSRVDRAIKEFADYIAAKGFEGPIVATYFDNPARTAPALQRAEISIAISRETALEMIQAARPEQELKEEDLLKELESERGAQLEDVYFVRFQKSKLVAALTVSAPFQLLPDYYTGIQTWIWNNGYYLIGPVREIYFSPVVRGKKVRAELQIGVEKTGVPDRR